MKVMISIPMDGELESSVKLKMEKIAMKLNKMHIEVVDTYFKEDPPKDYNNKGLYYMARSIEVMARCDAIIFAKGWERSKGCQMERLMAQQYGLKVLDQDFIEEPAVETVKNITSGYLKTLENPTTLYRNSTISLNQEDNHIPHVD